jgi:aspartate ammonia-lyase
VLKRIAVKLSKICNDLRLLSSGPRTGLGEINLPPVQAGSSIMPGKVNPVIPEAVNQVAFRVAGNDVTATMAAEAGQLQLNAFEPVIAHCRWNPSPG